MNHKVPSIEKLQPQALDCAMDRYPDTRYIQAVYAGRVADISSVCQRILCEIPDEIDGMA